jgi:PAS domain-containing protein
MSNFFKKFSSFFRNGSQHKKPIVFEKTKMDIIEAAEWEEEKIDSAILSEINSDIRALIDSFKALNFNLLILNQDYRIVFASDQFLTLTDFTIDYLIGKQISQIFPEPLTEREKQDLLGEIGAISTSKKILLITGENIPVQLYIQCVTGLDETCYTVIVVPLGGRKSF